jgi:hypothetical protein
MAFMMVLAIAVWRICATGTGRSAKSRDSGVLGKRRGRTTLTASCLDELEPSLSDQLLDPLLDPDPDSFELPGIMRPYP